jgi:hypothetical protein
VNVRMSERENSPRRYKTKRGEGNGDRVTIGGMDRRTTQPRRRDERSTELHRDPLRGKRDIARERTNGKWSAGSSHQAIRGKRAQGVSGPLPSRYTHTGYLTGRRIHTE